jgi:hypothetical protein
MNKTVLITGASSGIGAGCRNSRHADQPGHRNNRIKEITQVRLYVDKDKRYGHLAFEYIRDKGMRSDISSEWRSQRCLYPEKDIVTNTPRYFLPMCCGLAHQRNNFVPESVCTQQNFIIFVFNH